MERLGKVGFFFYNSGPLSDTTWQTYNEMSMEKKAKDDDPQQRSPASGNLAPDNGLENDIEIPQKRVNGGLDAWLSVLAGFCVFVNSWLVSFFAYDMSICS